MLNLTFHPDVSQEIKSSYNWYQFQAKGLGDDFMKELESAFKTIQSLPRTLPKFGANHHRFLLSRFPFSVIYQIHAGNLYVVAIMHNSKNPDYWSSRR